MFRAQRHRDRAGNACLLNDGAAALVITSDTKAKELALTPLAARIVSTGVSGLSPEIMGLGPIEASKKALQRAKLSIKDIDLVGDQRRPSRCKYSPRPSELGIAEDKLNVSGGAIALGHPFGMTGARIATTAAEQPDHTRQDVRPGDHAGRRRPGHRRW